MTAAEIYAAMEQVKTAVLDNDGDGAPPAVLFRVLADAFVNLSRIADAMDKIAASTRPV